MANSVTVETSARLHLGFLDLNGGAGRKFGSLGLALDGPVTELTIRRSNATRIEGPESKRIAAHLALLCERLGLTHNYNVTINKAIPMHAGLGSGTQLALALAAALRHLETLPPDPHGNIYGFFDGHGWNMAFNHAQGRLNGIYDFADSGFGPLHQEFIYSNFISPDLTARIISAYEMLTGRRLDRRRIAILTGFHRLSELAELADDPAHVGSMVQNAASCAAIAAHAG